jgi:hypothetical protein
VNGVQVAAEGSVTNLISEYEKELLFWNRLGNGTTVSDMDVRTVVGGCEI